jgi:transposase
MRKEYDRAFFARCAELIGPPMSRRQVLPFFEKLPPSLVGMEACATAHHWGREIERLGHRVRLMPPRYVKAYVKTFVSARWRGHSCAV